jgi:hypothetical protein
MKAVLEKPVKKSAKAQTPFDAQAAGVPGWLSCKIWNTPPSFPNRSRCADVVLEHEKTEAALIVREYRKAEQLAADNDLGARQSKLEDMNPMKKLAPEQRQAIQKEIQSCDRQQFLVAITELRELRESAADLAKTILQRLIVSFDEDLNDRALEAEGRLMKDGIALQNQGDWELWRMPFVVNAHSWREVCRNAFRNINGENAVGAIQWLATDEENVPSVPWM